MSRESPNPTGPHKCPTVFVPDFPSQRDSFETNKAYKRIISAIVDIVDSPNNDGMSIGVEGSWGAGKTTIINLLRDELRNSRAMDQGKGPICLIAFDAWAHEGDPLRLTFLEALKDGLIAERWVDKKKWDERLDIISGRKEVRDTASDYGLTWFDYVIAFSFFLIPVGVALLQAALRNGITIDNTKPVSRSFLLGLLLCIAPALLVLVKWLGQLVVTKLMRSRTRSNQATLRTKQSFLTLLLNRTLSAERTVVLKTPEPTSTEFEKQFQELMSDALHHNKERRVLLVIDNLDRVQPPQAVAIWSTLQTFLQHRHHNPPGWLKQLYTIVLYDPKRIGEQRSKPDTKTSSATEDFLEVGSQFQPTQELEGSFLDKSFQIRLEVPPPILSDWRSYLLDLLKTALPRHDSEHHEIYRVMAVERHRRPPSIRELKVYVNQICAIHLQWEDSFPLSHVAYYVRLKRKQEDIVDGLVSGRYPELAYSAILGERVRDSLASLSFNVEPNIAYQLLLGDPIEEALADITGDRLKDLKENFENGFWEALENVVSSDWHGGQSEKLGRGILAMEQSGVLTSGSERAEARSVRKALERSARSIKAWKPFDPTVAKGLSVLCQWSLLSSSSDDLVKRQMLQLLEAVAEGLFERNPARKDPIVVPEWLNALNTLIHRNRSLGLPHLDYINIIVSEIRNRLKNCDYVEAEEISRLLEVLVELNPTEPVAGDTLRALGEGGQILHYFSYVHGRSAHDSCAWCILTLLCFAPSFKPWPTVGNSAHGYATLLELAKKKDLQDIQELAKLLMRYQNSLTSVVLEHEGVLKEFVSECLKHIASGPSNESFFTPRFILENWSFFGSTIGEWKRDVPGFSNILERLANNTELTEEIQRRGFKAEESDRYRYLIGYRESDSPEFRSWCRANLEKLTTAEWESDIQNHWQLVHLASALRKTGTPLILGEQFLNAIVATVDRAIRRTEKKPFTRLFDMGFLLDPLDDSERRSVCGRVYEMVKQAKGELPSGFFSSFGKFISEVLRLDQESVALILRPILEKQDERGLKWLTKLFEENPSLLEKESDPQAVSDFKGIVQTALSQPGEAVAPFTYDLAHAIGVKTITE